MSKGMSDFKEELRFFTEENIESIEKFTIGQSENEHWFEYCQCLITASKAHEVATKITKVEKGGGGTINMWSLNMSLHTEHAADGWTPYGVIIDEIYFDNEFSCLMKINFKNIMGTFFKVCFGWVESRFYLGTLLFGIKQQYWQV